MDKPHSNLNATAAAPENNQTEKPAPFHTQSTELPVVTPPLSLPRMVVEENKKGPRLCKVSEIINADSMIEQFKVNTQGWPSRLATRSDRLKELNVQLRGSLRELIFKLHGKVYFANVDGKYFGLYGNDDPAVRSPVYKLYIEGKFLLVDGFKVDWNLYVYGSDALLLLLTFVIPQYVLQSAP